MDSKSELEYRIEYVNKNKSVLISPIVMGRSHGVKYGTIDWIRENKKSINSYVMQLTTCMIKEFGDIVPSKENDYTITRPVSWLNSNRVSSKAQQHAYTHSKSIDYLYNLQRQFSQSRMLILVGTYMRNDIKYAIFRQLLNLGVAANTPVNRYNIKKTPSVKWDMSLEKIREHYGKTFDSNQVFVESLVERYDIPTCKNLNSKIENGRTLSHAQLIKWRKYVPKTFLQMLVGNNEYSYGQSDSSKKRKSYGPQQIRCSFKEENIYKGLPNQEYVLSGSFRRYVIRFLNEHGLKPGDLHAVSTLLLILKDNNKRLKKNEKTFSNSEYAIFSKQASRIQVSDKEANVIFENC